MPDGVFVPSSRLSRRPSRKSRAVCSIARSTSFLPSPDDSRSAAARQSNCSHPDGKWLSPDLLDQLIVFGAAQGIPDSTAMRRSRLSIIGLDVSITRPLQVL